MSQDLDPKKRDDEGPSHPGRRWFFTKPVEKLLVKPAPEPVVEPNVDAMKTKIAERVRWNAKERSAVTTAAAVTELMAELPQERQGTILAEMGAEEQYADIKAVVTASGQPYLFSTTYLQPAEATAASEKEDWKIQIAELVRADSRERIVLTPASAVLALVPDGDLEKLAAILKEMAVDPRYADIKAVTGSKGDVYLHCDTFLSGRYAAILLRAAAKDPCATIATTVRDESQLYPRPTNTKLFLEKAFAIDPAELEARLEETLRKPEYGDLRKMVHPKTGAVYLYSSTHMGQEQAWWIMNWEEVGRDANP